MSECWHTCLTARAPIDISGFMCGGASRLQTPRDCLFAKKSLEDAILLMHRKTTLAPNGVSVKQPGSSVFVLPRTLHPAQQQPDSLLNLPGMHGTVCCTNGTISMFGSPCMSAQELHTKSSDKASADRHECDRAEGLTSSLADAATAVSALCAMNFLALSCRRS